MMGSLVAGGWPELFTKRERYLALLLMFTDFQKKYMQILPFVDKSRQLFAKFLRTLFYRIAVLLKPIFLYTECFCNFKP